MNDEQQLSKCMVMDLQVATGRSQIQTPGMLKTRMYASELAKLDKRIL